MPNKKKHYSAVKVDPKHAIIPPPTTQLLNELAMGIHLSVAGAAAIQRNEGEESFPEWNNLPEEVKDYWIEGARCAYSIIAIHGGADVTGIPSAQES